MPQSGKKAGGKAALPQKKEKRLQSRRKRGQNGGYAATKIVYLKRSVCSSIEFG
jgi:hypothetical protein